MKRVFLIVCVGMMSLVASAQLTWNVKAGLGTAWCPTDEDGISKKTHVVGKLGVGLEKPFTQNFSVMPSLELALKGTKWKLVDLDETFEQQVNLTYLQIPILGAYRFNLNDSWNIVAKAGPYFAYALSGNVKEDSDEYDIFDKTEMEGDTANRFDAGIILGADFEYHRFVAGVELEYGLTNIVDWGQVDVKNVAGYITVGYKF